MRKHVSKRKKPEKSLFSMKRIFVISVILMILSGMMGVMATNDKVSNVKIKLSNGYEMDVVTSNKTVREILAESHIIVLDDETVTPGLDEEITDNKTITVVHGKLQEESIEQYFSADEITKSYEEIVEKIVTVEEEIPFETITKDVSEGSAETVNRITQIGVNGIKEVTYRIKYQNGNEIEKTVVSETVVKEKEDKIVEVATKTTSRYGSRASGGSAAEYQAYAEQKCAERGWSSADFDSLVSLWNRESGWNANSHNSSSGAHGIAQALPASKMASYGSDYYTNGYVQVDWGLDYIAGRYGTPSNAWASFCRKGWY